MNTIADTDLAWIAGFIDGEGTIAIAVNGGVTLQVGNTDSRPVQFLAETFGGSVNERRASVLSPRRFWVWVVQRRHAEHALRLLLPHLRVKRDSAELALRARALVGHSGLRVSAERKALIRELRRRLSSRCPSPRSKRIARVKPLANFEERFALAAANKPGTYTSPDGRSGNLGDWGRWLGMTRGAVRDRIQKWGVERALTTPRSPEAWRAGLEAANARWKE